MKQTAKSMILLVVILTLIAVAIFLLLDRVLPKSFSDFVSGADSFESCQIISVAADGDDAGMIAGEKLEGLLSLLNQQKFYKQGTYGNIMEGNIYILFFSSAQAEPIEIKISDLGKVYIGSVCYELAPDVPEDSISGYLETLLA